MKLVEVLNTKIDIEIVRDEGTEFETEAAVGGRVIRFSAIQGSRDHGKWIVEFTEEGNYDLTGNGKEFEVFSMVKQSIELLIKKHDPQSLWFSASKKEKGRASLYERMLKKFIGSEWTYEKREDPEVNLEYFIVKRK